MEGLLAARLNTSRLLHTRLHWRPEAMEEIRVFFLEKAIEDVVKAKGAFSEMHYEISDEVIFIFYLFLISFQYSNKQLKLLKLTAVLSNYQRSC